MSEIFVVVVMSVGHLSPSPAIFLSRWSSFFRKDVMLFDMRLSSFCTGLSTFFLISSGDDVRCGVSYHILGKSNELYIIVLIAADALLVAILCATLCASVLRMFR